MDEHLFEQKTSIVILRSNPVDPDPRVEKTAKTLAGAEFDVIVLGWDRTGLLPVHTVQDGIHIHRLPIRAAFGHGMANLPNLLRWQWGLLQWLISHRRHFYVIHACDFDTLLPALACKWLWGKMVVYDIFDFYADHLRATPNFIKQIIKAVDIKSIGWVNALILADDSRREQVKAARPRRVVVIYNTPTEIQLTGPLISQPVPVKEERHASPLNLVYVGLLQVERGLLQMLEVLAHHPEWSLNLAGFGGDEEKIQRLVQDMPNVRWHGRISYPKAIQLSREADALFATYDPAIPNHRYSSPNKVFEAMLLGKPIIVARGTNMDRIVEAAECGIVVEYGDVPGLEVALKLLQSDTKFRDRLGRNARRAYETVYSWGEMQTRLLDLYAWITNQ